MPKSQEEHLPAKEAKNLPIRRERQQTKFEETRQELEDLEKAQEELKLELFNRKVEFITLLTLLSEVNDILESQP